VPPQFGLSVLESLVKAVEAQESTTKMIGERCPLVRKVADFSCLVGRDKNVIATWNARTQRKARSALIT
jgi:hypothetical protein